jgi:hypothetical protein
MGDHDIRDQCSLVSAQTEFGLQIRRYILNHHPEPGAAYFAFPQLRPQLFGHIDRDGETDADIAAALHENRRIDADHFPIHVQNGSAAVSGIDGVVL